VFVAASLAKMGATVLTYPVLLVKTRLQASAGKNRGGKKPRLTSGDDEGAPKTTFAREAPSYDGAFDALRRIAREEGVAAFYRGMGTKMTQTVFAAALMFVTKEEIAKAARAASETIAARRLRNAG
jgi:adenine nucleotide transporter 17